MSTAPSQSFGTQLKRLRLAAGLTQEGLAERAGLSAEGISALERGVNRAPRKDTIALLAEALALTPQDRAILDAAARRRVDTMPQQLQVAGALTGGQQTLPIRGRESELAAIERHLSGDGPPLLLISGEPGIGKTRLLHETASLAAVYGWTVLAGGCQRRAGQEPFSPLLSALTHYLARHNAAQQRAFLAGCGWMARLLPELATVLPPSEASHSLPPEQERRLMFAAVARFLANVAGPAGTLVILDDLQWADADGLDLLVSLLHMPSAAPLRVIGAYRDTELSPSSPLTSALADLTSVASGAPLRLEPLDQTARTQLLATLTEDTDVADAALSARIIERTGGVPFFLVSCVQGLRGQANADAVPWDVAQSIRQRLADVPEATRELLGVAAVAGQIVTRRLLTDVERARGRDDEEVVAAIEAACRARLLLEAGDADYQFANDLIRDVITRELGAARRAALHRRVAAALEATAGPKPVDALAFHYAHGGVDEKAIMYAALAATRAIGMNAYTTAETYLADLVRRLDALGEEQRAAVAREQLGEVRIALARYDSALHVLEQANAAYHSLGEHEGVGRVAVAIGQVHANRGTASEGAEWLQGAIQAAETRQLSDRVRAALYDMWAQLLHLTGRYADQLRAAETAAQLARASGDGRLVAQVEMRRGNALRMLGRMTEAASALEDVLQVAEAAGDVRTLAAALDNVSVVYLLSGELERSDRYIERAVALAERLADPLVIQLMLLRRGINAFALGEWPRAQEAFDRATDMMRQVGISWVAAYTSLGHGQLALARGQRDAAARYLADSIALGERIGDLQALRWAQTAAAEAELLDGKPDRARQRLEPLLDRPGQQEGLVTYLMPYLAWACLDGGDAPRARSLLDECLVRSRHEHIHLALVDALRVRALIAMRDADWADGASALDEGLALSQAMRYPYGEARLLYTYGLLLSSQDRTDEARERNEQALQLLTALGEHLYAEHIAAAQSR